MLQADSFVVGLVAMTVGLYPGDENSYDSMLTNESRNTKEALDKCNVLLFVN